MFLSTSAQRRVRERRRSITQVRLYLHECLWAESLESRQLLAVANAASLAGIMAAPAVQMLTAQPLVTNPNPTGMTPAQIRQAYGFNQIQGDGTGQTIAIIDAYNDPNLLKDLDTFDKQFGETASGQSLYNQFGSASKFLTVLNQSGGTRLPRNDAGWALEESLDVEWAHAMAPGAKIMLVEAGSASLSNLLSAVNYARNQPGVSAVSMSWGSNEFSSETGYDWVFTTPSGHGGVTFVASSGDDGGVNGPSWPATSINVLSVGGTTLSIDASGNYLGESGWGGSSGGNSLYEPEPAYQLGIQQTGVRTTPDVAYNGDPASGMAVYDSYSYQGQSGWFAVGGTSAGAPQWAAIVALSNQARAAAQASALDGVGQTLPGLYSFAGTSAFHDVTTGSNAHFSAGAGYDLVTGLGSPAADAIVRVASGGTLTAAPTTAATTTSQPAVAIITTTSAPTSGSGSGASTHPDATRAPAVVFNGSSVIVLIVLQPAFVPTLASTSASPVATLVGSALAPSTTLVGSSQVSPGQSLIAWKPTEILIHATDPRDEPLPIAPAEPSQEGEISTPAPANPASVPSAPVDLGPMNTTPRPLDPKGNQPGTPVPSEPAIPLPGTDQDESRKRTEATLSAGLALALWFAWERHNARTGRQQKRRFLEL